MTKPTPQQVWQGLLDEAFEAEFASLEAMTDAQIEAELAGAGFDVAEERAKAERFLDDLTAAQPAPVQAVAPGPPVELAPRRRRPRTTLFLLAAATTAAAAGGLAYSALHHPTPPSPSPEPSPAPSPSAPAPPPPSPELVAAAELRQKAIAACDAEQWTTCLADLDQARALDPAGDDAPDVKAMREQARRGTQKGRLK